MYTNVVHLLPDSLHSFSQFFSSTLFASTCTCNSTHDHDNDLSIWLKVKSVSSCHLRSSHVPPVIHSQSTTAHQADVQVTALMDMKGSTSICQSKVDDSREAHDVVCRDLQAPGTRAVVMKRKTPRTKIRAHRDRCQRATKEFETVEKDLNDSLGRPGHLINDTAGATHTLSCGVPDRESNETRYLQEAVDLIEEFERRGSNQGTTEITLVERLC